MKNDIFPAQGILMNNEKHLEVQSVLAKAIKRAGELHNNDKLKKQAGEMEKNIREHKKKEFKVLRTGSKSKSYKSWNIGKWKHCLYCKNNNVILQVKAGNEEAGFPGEIIKFSKSFNSNEEAKNFAESFSKIPFWRAKEHGFIKKETIILD